ncbi:hypothetical protein ASPZODRAFT_144908 [Penicilliopsis zonata CBS 506.65]|uniref:Actin-related protein RO7 n=1 Tax=Penicilliopsis zonata CBS 506.65 TaxID=1073090 RepID=A0A1L9SAW5_9EURO|nr:hypothetical protein ASPZODRAFT_144908 [Penicilliopsis zonata CBS 506.65]OJJ44332.1 hypothetical protein ASPZODRAFT_144908 [Penicilliopsis zonata CBS 506.65]
MATAPTAAAIDGKYSATSGSNIRSNLRHSQQRPPNTPHTPQHSRGISSFASTSSQGSLRNDEDAIIFEIGSRWLRAGFEGDSTPMCSVGFGPEESRRVGDYRGWARNNSSQAEEKTRQEPVDPDFWASPYELWRMDLRDMDLGLVEDRIERAFRETYNKYLLTDAGTSRLVLVLPSLMPHPLLSSVLSTLFSRWRFPSITLLPGAAMATAAAGLRAALVVDIGWAETTVTGVYEYREIAIKRSTRGMRSLTTAMGRFLSRLARKDNNEAQEGQPAALEAISVDFEYCEDVVNRFAWCRPCGHDEESTGQDEEEPSDPRLVSKKIVSIPSPSTPGLNYIELPFGSLAEPVEQALFAQGLADCVLDDQEKPLHVVVYNTLLALPPDIRGTCMSRIIFVGGGAHIPGIRRRTIQEVQALVDQYGWSPVRGKVVDEQLRKLQDLRLSKQPPPAAQQPEPTHEEKAEEQDFVEQKLRRNNRDKDLKPFVHGMLRDVESLGAWAGASLVTALKVRGLVEIEREKYVQHGLAGASRDLDTHVPDRRSGLRAGDRSSWTLAGWG